MISHLFVHLCVLMFLTLSWIKSAEYVRHGRWSQCILWVYTAQTVNVVNTGGPPLTRKSLTRFPLPCCLAYVRVSGGISVSRGPRYSPTNTNFISSPKMRVSRGASVINIVLETFGKFNICHRKVGFPIKKYIHWTLSYNSFYEFLGFFLF